MIKSGRSGGAEERRSGGAEERRSGGAESGGAEERRSGGADEGRRRGGGGRDIPFSISYVAQNYTNFQVREHQIRSLWQRFQNTFSYCCSCHTSLNKLRSIREKGNPF